MMRGITHDEFMSAIAQLAESRSLACAKEYLENMPLVKELISNNQLNRVNIPCSEGGRLVITHEIDDE